MKTTILALLCTALATLGCNTALVDASYHGEPLLTLQGQVQIVPTAPEGRGDGKPKPPDDKAGKEGPKEGPKPVVLPAGALRLAIVWESEAVENHENAAFSAFEQSVELTSQFPAGYVMTLFTPPPDAVMHKATNGAAYALGTIVAYADADGDGRFDAANDTLIGGATGRALVWAASELSAPWLREPMSKGYHRLRVRPDKQVCDEFGHVQFEADPLPDTDLQVFESFPKDAMVDLNCDGKRDEWGAACPPKDHLKKKCKTAPADYWPCQDCPF